MGTNSERVPRDRRAAKDGIPKPPHSGASGSGGLGSRIGFHQCSVRSGREVYTSGGRRLRLGLRPQPFGVRSLTKSRQARDLSPSRPTSPGSSSFRFLFPAVIACIFPCPPCNTQPQTWILALRCRRHVSPLAWHLLGGKPGDRFDVCGLRSIGLPKTSRYDPVARRLTVCSFASTRTLLLQHQPQ
ncbi:hypothetical protein VTK26DRAFT_6556 [Humicola hyalothermophila]